MAFLTKQYQDYLNKLFDLKKSRKGFLIPIGIQELSVGKIEKKKSAAGNLMIVVSIVKHSDPKEFAPIRTWNVADYNNPKACNNNGIPYGVVGLEFFMVTAYQYNIIHYPNDKIDWIHAQVKDFIKKPFTALISHTASLLYKNNELIVKEGENMPVVIHSPEMIEYGPVGSELKFDGNYTKLTHGLSPQEKSIFNNYTLKAEQLYQTNINSIYQ